MNLKEIQDLHNGVRAYVLRCQEEGVPLKLNPEQYTPQKVLEIIRFMKRNDIPMKDMDLLCIVTEDMEFENGLLKYNRWSDDYELDIDIVIVAQAPLMAKILGDDKLAKQCYEKYGRAENEKGIAIGYDCRTKNKYLNFGTIVLEVICVLYERRIFAYSCWDEVLAKEGAADRFCENIGDFVKAFNGNYTILSNITYELIVRWKIGKNIAPIIPFVDRLMPYCSFVEKHMWDAFLDVHKALAKENADVKGIFERRFIKAVDVLLELPDQIVEKTVLEYLAQIKPEDYTVKDFIEAIFKYGTIKNSCVYLIWYRRVILNKQELVLHYDVEIEKKFIEAFFCGEWITPEEEATEEFKGRFEIMLDTVTFVRDKDIVSLPAEIERILRFKDPRLVAKAMKCGLITADYKTVCIEYCLANHIEHVIVGLLANELVENEKDVISETIVKTDYENESLDVVLEHLEHMMDMLAYLDKSGMLAREAFRHIAKNAKINEAMYRKNYAYYVKLYRNYAWTINTSPCVEV